MAGPKTWSPGDVLLSADQNEFEGFWGSYSGTTDGSNNLIVTHGCPFGPGFVLLQSSLPNGGGNQGFPVVMPGSIGATTFTLRYLNTAGSCALLAVAGLFLCLP